MTGTGATSGWTTTAGVGSTGGAAGSRDCTTRGRGGTMTGRWRDISASRGAARGAGGGCTRCAGLAAATRTGADFRVL